MVSFSDKKPQATGSTGRKLRVLKPKTSITTPKRDSTTRISKVPTKPRKRKDMSSTPLYLYCKDCGEKFMRACDLTYELSPICISVIALTDSADDISRLIQSHSNVQLWTVNTRRLALQHLKIVNVISPTDMK